MSRYGKVIEDSGAEYGLCNDCQELRPLIGYGLCLTCYKAADAQGNLDWYAYAGGGSGECVNCQTPFGSAEFATATECELCHAYRRKRGMARPVMVPEVEAWPLTDKSMETVKAEQPNLAGFFRVMRKGAERAEERALRLGRLPLRYRCGSFEVGSLAA